VSFRTKYTEKLETFSNIEIFLNKTPTAFIANDSALKKMTLCETETVGEIKKPTAFCFIGLIPNTKPLKD
jgi:alkyl hydroperoxide reductase subunit AhpF